MAGIDAFGQPTWSDLDPVDLATQLTQAADAVGHGPYRRGTQAQRTAITPLYDGLTFWQTDGTQRGLWRVEGGQWRHLAAIAHSVTGTNSSGSWSNIGPASALPATTPILMKVGWFKANTSGTGTLNFTYPAAFPTGTAAVFIQTVGGTDPKVYATPASGFSTLWPSQPSREVSGFYLAFGY